MLISFYHVLAWTGNSEVYHYCRTEIWREMRMDSEDKYHCLRWSGSRDEEGRGDRGSTSTSGLALVICMSIPVLYSQNCKSVPQPLWEHTNAETKWPSSLQGLLGISCLGFRSFGLKNAIAATRK